MNSRCLQTCVCIEDWKAPGKCGTGYIECELGEVITINGSLDTQ